MSGRRSLQTILFTDIVKSTEKAAELGDRGWSQLLERHHARVRREFHRHGGREIKSLGDGFLAVFSSPAPAIRCAWAIRGAVRELELEVRNGIHAGEVERDGGDLRGIAVHIGSRVAALAEPGEILVSNAVRELETGSGFRFADRGERVLEGVPGPWRLFAVESLPEGAPERAGGGIPRFSGRRARFAGGGGLALLVLIGSYLLVRSSDPVVENDSVGASAAGPGIAILPFRTSDPDLEEWREGIMDLVSMNVDGAAGLRAIDSRTVLARLEGGTSPELVDQAAALDATAGAGGRYAVIGTVSSFESQLRLSASVYDVESRESLGRVTAQGSPDSIYALIDRFSIDVLKTILKSEPEALPRVDLEHVTTSSLPALRAFLDGQVLYRRSEFNAAIPAYQKAVEEDSTFALALYRLGLAYSWAEDVESDLFVHYVERAKRFADRLPEREAIFVDGALALERGRTDGVAPLRLATRKYPDDTDGWYLLADSYYHLGARILVDDETAERTFARVIQVDPKFSPAYIHALDYAFFHADSVRAVELLDRYSRLAGGSRHEQRYRLTYALAWGDATQRRAARAILDTIDPREASRLLGRLWHPHFLDRVTDLYAALHPRAEDPARIARSLFWTNTYQGKGRAALEWLDDPSLASYAPRYELYWLHNRGWPVPAARLDQELQPAVLEDVPWPDLFYVAAYAADRGRWSEYRAGLDRMGQLAGAFDAETDSAQAAATRRSIRALEGLAQWRRGRPGDAVVTLERAFAEISDDAHGNIVRDWLAAVHQEVGQPAQAERYLRTYRAHHPLVEFSLGRLYMETGEYEKSRRSFGFFLLAWRDADAEVQSYAAEARQAIARSRIAVRD